MYSKEKYGTQVTCRSWQRYTEAYRQWLQLMNYHPTSINNGVVRIAFFFDWLNSNQVNRIDQITGTVVKDFFEYLSKHKSVRTGNILSIATQRNYLTTIKRFAKYLRQTGEGNIEVSIQFKGKSNHTIVVLTKEEIDRLYHVCDDGLLGIRDRTLLAVFYGCGVRRNEAVNIEIKDVLPDRNLLYIRKGKGYKERYVPMVGQVKTTIIYYLTVARKIMMNRQVHEMFFVGINGKPLQGSSMYERFKKLLKKAGIKKKAGLHTLRHSIATHLLLNGMKLSEIAKFLGHDSLESTQIYTHLKDGL